MAASQCIKAFILALLCGNPILRGTLITVLTSLRVTLQFQIDQLGLLVARINIHNRILSLGINTLNAAKDKVSADLNLVLGPFQQFFDCVELNKVLESLQVPAIGKGSQVIERKLAEFNRATNLSRLYDREIRKLESRIEIIDDIINEISTLCS